MDDVMDFRECIVQLGIFNRAEGRVVGWGSGSVISAHGHILTAAHILPSKAAAAAVLVGVFEGKGKPARWAYSCRVYSEEEALKLEAADKSLVDLAVLQINAKIEEAQPPVFDRSMESFEIIQETEIDPKALNMRYLLTSNVAQQLGQVRLFGYPKDRGAIRFKEDNSTACGQDNGWVKVNAIEVATSGCSGGPLLNDEGEIVAVMSLDYNDKRGLKSGASNLSWFRHLSMIQAGHHMPQSEDELPADRAVDAKSQMARVAVDLLLDLAEAEEVGAKAKADHLRLKAASSLPAGARMPDNGGEKSLAVPQANKQQAVFSNIFNETASVFEGSIFED
eukprot:g2472.t1